MRQRAVCKVSRGDRNYDWGLTRISRAFPQHSLVCRAGISFYESYDVGSLDKEIASGLHPARASSPYFISAASIASIHVGNSQRKNTRRLIKTRTAHPSRPHSSTTQSICDRRLTIVHKYSEGRSAGGLTAAFGCQAIARVSLTPFWNGNVRSECAAIPHRRKDSQLTGLIDGLRIRVSNDCLRKSHGMETCFAVAGEAGRSCPPFAWPCAPLLPALCHCRLAASPAGSFALTRGPVGSIGVGT
jgi:hypothetical protein